MGRYFVGSPGDRDGKWISTAARTLTGAKRIASATYQVTRDGVIQVGQELAARTWADGNPSDHPIEIVARKVGYGRWEDHS